ncbi:hypothetical protein U0070_023490, partial [Myodes glareolus]
MTLNMKNYKGYEKKPYCNAHYPKQSFTMVADTPENLRLKQQSELQSQEHQGWGCSWEGSSALLLFCSPPTDLDALDYQGPGVGSC